MTTQTQQPDPTTQDVVPTGPLKSVATAYLLTAASLIGVCGLQHFYLRDPRRGFLWLFTLGLLGVGVLVDLVTLPARVRLENVRISSGVRSC